MFGVVAREDVVLESLRGLKPTTLAPQFDRLDYSLRRYYVDEFHTRKIAKLPAGSKVLDLGGTKIGKRGTFDVESYDLRVVYANLSTVKQPDVQATAECIPFKDCSFDAVICSELLEHVPNPREVVEEAHRVLRPGGRLLVCAPFLVRIHDDPYDYGRYTDTFWRETLAAIGFADIAIEKHGLFWSVLVEMVRAWLYQRSEEGRLPFRSFVLRILLWARGAALRAESQLEYARHPFFNSFTTGFGICAIRAN